MPLRAAMPKSISLTVPSVVIITLLGLTSRCTMPHLLEHVLQSAADAAGDEDREVDVGQVAELAVPLEVLDEAPAVDVLEHDAQLAVDALEVEDAADVLVVEHRVPARLLHEQAQVARARVSAAA